MRTQSISRNFINIFLCLAVIMSLAVRADAEKQDDLANYWKPGERLIYEVTFAGRTIGSAVGEFVGKVKHGTVGSRYLIDCRTDISVLNLTSDYSVSSQMYTSDEGRPVYYEVNYVEKGDERSMDGVHGMGEFLFKEFSDTGEARFRVSYSPESVLCDRQTIPHWNVAFSHVKNMTVDTLVFKVMIPYLKKRVVMKMARHPDTTLVIMEDSIKCHTYFSLRTDEYYYVTPDRRVVMVDFPKQNLIYKLKEIMVADKKE